jgi:hypothetical protein
MEVEPIFRLPGGKTFGPTFSSKRSVIFGRSGRRPKYCKEFVKSISPRRVYRNVQLRSAIGIKFDMYKPASKADQDADPMRMEIVLDHALGSINYNQKEKL